MVGESRPTHRWIRPEAMRDSMAISGPEHADLRAVLDDLAAMNKRKIERLVKIERDGWHLNEEYMAYRNGAFEWGTHECECYHCRNAEPFPF